MSEDRCRKIARATLKRVIESTPATELSSVIMNGSTKARLALEQLESHLDKGMALIQDSDHKEHIYSEAGDLISETRTLIEDLKDGLGQVSYAALKIEEKKLRNNVPAKIRDRVDRAVKKDV